MAGTPPASSSSLQADSPKDKCPSPFRLHLPATEQSLPDGDLFVKVYEHVAGLMKIEKHKEADEMDSSPSIAALAGIAEDSWKPFDVIWTARLFREMLYHTIASGEGGPLWLRETLRVKYAKDMCMTLMPHVRSARYFHSCWVIDRANQGERYGSPFLIKPRTTSTSLSILRRHVALV